MLKEVGLITTEEYSEITVGLNQIKKEFNENNWIPAEDEYEDVHSAVEAKLKELIGETAGKLHTGRSRNDQVATDMRLWIQKSAAILQQANKKLQQTLV